MDYIKQQVGILSGNTLSGRNVDTPTECLYCHSIVGALHISEDYTRHQPMLYHDLSSDTYTMTVRCPVCKRHFTLEYDKEFKMLENRLIPTPSKDIPKDIADLSPDFKEIYIQAKLSEDYQLDRISGVSYRKALEFLVKDYAILKKPDKEDEIKKMFLGKVIENFLEDFPKIQTLAKASTWIGNDETHYERRHTDKNIEDLKRLLLATVNIISADLLVAEAYKFIDSDQN
ncbi:DUF4145 domain-containing protein [Lactococcus sp. KTH0-1S]|uniref:DUF4145 domain-containing protein n=1 Tax=Lactococcus sp. KTH0-1S TaxID=3438232 RepID=UPI00403C7312